PRSAAEYAMKTTAKDARNRLIGSVMQQWARADLDEALAWLDHIDDRTARGQILSSVIGSISGSDPAKAGELAMQIPTSDAQRNAVSNVAANWANQDPEAARQWINGLPEGIAR